MKITITAHGKKGIYARPIELLDLFNFAETMADWPKDHEGTFTLERSIKVVNKHVRHMDRFHHPLEQLSKFNSTWVMCEADGTFIGYWRDKIEGRHAHFAQNAIHPRQRGKGYNRLIAHLRTFLSFYVFKVEGISGEVMSGNAVITRRQLDKVQDASVSWKGDRTGSTGQTVSRWEVSLKQHKVAVKAWADGTEPTDPKDDADGFSTKNMYKDNIVFEENSTLR